MSLGSAIYAKNDPPLNFVITDIHFILYMRVLPACMHVLHACAWCPQKLEEEIGSSRIGVRDSCESRCEYWESNTVPLEEQQGPLTAEPHFVDFGRLCFVRANVPMDSLI